jgi:hypothetical protein
LSYCVIAQWICAYISLRDILKNMLQRRGSTQISVFQLMVSAESVMT